MSHRRKFIQQITSIGAISLVTPTKLLADTDTEHLCIMHTNDVHSHIEPFPKDHKKYPGMGGVAKRARLINKIRSEVRHTLLLDAGDMLSYAVSISESFFFALVFKRFVVFFWWRNRI